METFIKTLMKWITSGIDPQNEKASKRTLVKRFCLGIALTLPGFLIGPPADGKGVSWIYYLMIIGVFPGVFIILFASLGLLFLMKTGARSGSGSGEGCGSSCGGAGRAIPGRIEALERPWQRRVTALALRSRSSYS